MRRNPIQAGIRSGPADDAGASPLGDELREALSWWASGVGVLAARDDDGEVEAITVSAFSGVSLDPPLVLVCVGEQAAILPMILEQQRFALSVLAAGDQPRAAAFAQRLPLRRGDFPPEGPPVLEGSLVALDCRLWRADPGGDHRILIGEVEHVRPGQGSDPLLFFRREYRRLGNG